MEPVRDVHDHMLCCADAHSGMIVKTIGRKETIRVFLPVGGEISFTRPDSYTCIRREGHCFLYVNRTRLDSG